MVTIYLMRHGQTYLNKYERMQGWSDAPLTLEGEKGCIASGKGLSDIVFDAVYTSDLKRTRLTAELVLSQNKKQTDYEIIEMPEFREVFFGSFEGLPIEEVWPKIIKTGDIRKDGQRVLNALHQADPLKEAENYHMFWSRVENGLIKVVEKHKESQGTVLIVSHGMTIRNILQGIIPDLKEFPRFDNASVTKIRYEKGQFHLDYLNKTDHFVWSE